jgi:hypothetical protein
MFLSSDNHKLELSTIYVLYVNTRVVFGFIHLCQFEEQFCLHVLVDTSRSLLDRTYIHATRLPLDCRMAWPHSTGQFKMATSRWCGCWSTVERILERKMRYSLFVLFLIQSDSRIHGYWYFALVFDFNEGRSVETFDKSLSRSGSNKWCVSPISKPSEMHKLKLLDS